MSLSAAPNTVFRYTAPRNTTWTCGQSTDSSLEGKEWVDGVKAGWKVIDPAKMDALSLNHFMRSGVVPRPIAFVSTVSENGEENVAPYSWFNMVSPNPPTIMISCAHPPGRIGGRDTAINIKQTKGFVVNIISEPWVNQANMASVDAPNGVSEWDLTGLTKKPSIHMKPPRVKESAFSMECELLQTIPLTDPATGEVKTTVIFGSVKYIHVRNDVLNERGNVDPQKLKPVAMMGDITYARVVEAFKLPRPLWETYENNVELKNKL